MSGYDIRKLALTPAQKILSEVATAHGLTVADLRGRSRVTLIVHARQEARYRLVVELGWSTPRIGSLLRRDASTVAHGIGAHCLRAGISAARPAMEAGAARYDTAGAG